MKYEGEPAIDDGVIYNKTIPGVREVKLQNYYNPAGSENYTGLTQKNTTEETTTETATTSLEGTVTTSNNTVTLKTNKPVEKVEGWTKVDDTTLTKTYSESGNYSVDIEDEIGNEATIKFSVDADKEVETEQEAETESTTNTENTVKTESTTNTESTVETESTTNANVVE